MKVYQKVKLGQHLIVLDGFSFEFSQFFTTIHIEPTQPFLARWFVGWRSKTLTSAEFLVLQERLSLELNALKAAYQKHQGIDLYLGPKRTLKKAYLIEQLEEAIKIYLESQ